VVGSRPPYNCILKLTQGNACGPRYHCSLRTVDWPLLRAHFASARFCEIGAKLLLVQSLRKEKTSFPHASIPGTKFFEGLAEACYSGAKTANFSVVENQNGVASGDFKEIDSERERERERAVGESRG